jgi:hypothetical protein
MLMIDLRGEKFGRLRVLELDDEPKQRQHCEWQCVCSCHRVVSVRSDKLRSGRIKSCNCAQHLKRSVEPSAEYTAGA